MRKQQQRGQAMSEEAKDPDIKNYLNLSLRLGLENMGLKL